MDFINRYLKIAGKGSLVWMLLGVIFSGGDGSRTQAAAFLAFGEVVTESRTWFLECRGSTVEVLESSSGRELSAGRSVVLLEPKGASANGLPVFLVREQHAPWEVQTLGASGTWNPSLYSGPRAHW